MQAAGIDHVEQFVVADIHVLRRIQCTTVPRLGEERKECYVLDFVQESRLASSGLENLLGRLIRLATQDIITAHDQNGDDCQRRNDMPQSPSHFNLQSNVESYAMNGAEPLQPAECIIEA